MHRNAFPKLFLLAVLPAIASAQSPEQPTKLEVLDKFQPLEAPQPKQLLLKEGDRLAICGDSITEQKQYSRLIEDYMTMCVPELKVSVRQYGWSGERAPGFLARMTNDCLRFKPTIATTCYGMNDHEYRRYEEKIGETYRTYSAAIVESFKANGVRVIQGSPGCVGKLPPWTRSTNSTLLDLNQSLCNLRNIGVELAKKEKVGFADVFWPMLTAGVTAKERFSTNYAIAGKDGVHPGWAGHTVMAYAFLKAFGLSGDLGTFAADLKSHKMKVTKGHKVRSGKENTFEITSDHYPFCGCVNAAPEPAPKPPYPVCSSDDLESDNSIQSAMSLIPFNRDLNRLTLVARNGTAQSYKVTWGSESKSFSAGQLSQGINLTEEFPTNPFTDAFAKVDAAIAAKQAYETKQIKQAMHSSEAKSNPGATAASTEKEREPLVAAVKAAFVPVTHTLKIEAE